jgi:hypothetical protein
MKRFSRYLFPALTLAITAGLVWLPTAAQAGLTVTAID